jgi:transcriptional regulator with XRE-family HTH domain
MAAANSTKHEVRPLTPNEIAALVVTYRQTNGWSQEQLSDISGVTVRTVQRVEKAEPSSVDTKRALARAFELEDIDIFNRGHSFKTAEQMQKDAEDFQERNLMLDAVHATSGKQLADLSEEMTMHNFTIPDGLPAETATDMAALYDNMRDYGDVHDHHGFGEKVGFHGILDDLVDSIRKQGFSICYGVRRTKLTNDSWINKTPWPVTIGYVFAVPVGSEPKLVAVPKTISPSF